MFPLLITFSQNKGWVFLGAGLALAVNFYLIDRSKRNLLMTRRILSRASLFTAMVLPLKTSAQGPPIHTDTPILLGLEGRGAMIRVVLVRKSTLYREHEKIPDPLNREVTGVVGMLAIPYNVTTRLLVGATIPVMNLESKSSGTTHKVFGLGDVSIFTKQLIVQVDGLQKTFRIAAKGAVKLPTGDENRTPALGTGTVDYTLGAVGAWIGQRIGVNADVT